LNFGLRRSGPGQKPICRNDMWLSPRLRPRPLTAFQDVHPPPQPGLGRSQAAGVAQADLVREWIAEKLAAR